MDDELRARVARAMHKVAARPLLWKGVNLNAYEALLPTERNLYEKAADAAIAECFRWRPMETAPIDGTEVDLWIGFRRLTDCHYHLGDWLRWEATLDTEPHWGKVENPESWMPIVLPPSPVDAKLEGGE